MFSEKDRVFVTIPNHAFHGETCVVVKVIPAELRTDYGKNLFDHVHVKYADDTVKWFDETVLKRDRRSGELDFESYAEKRKPTIMNRLMKGLI